MKLRAAIVCSAVRPSAASDSNTFFGGRVPPSPFGSAALLLLVSRPTVTWLSRYTHLMKFGRCQLDRRFGSLAIAGFQPWLMLPSSLGRPPVGPCKVEPPRPQLRSELPPPV